MASFLVVGSDTGVGKTVFTGLLGHYLLMRGLGVYLTKPFCSGGNGDIQFQLSAQNDFGNPSKVNFWYDDEPVSPAAWELSTGNQIDFEGIIKKVQKEFTKDNRDILLVEGVGGLLAPITRNRTVGTIGQELFSKIIIVAPNRVGVINHVLLTLEAALRLGLTVSCVVLIRQQNPDASAAYNAELISIHMPNMVDFKGIYEFPWLGEEADNPDLIANNFKKAEGILEEIFNVVINPYLYVDSNN